MRAMRARGRQGEERVTHRHRHSDSAPHAHRAYAPASVRCAIVTIGESRGDADAAGDLAASILAGAGHEIAARSHASGASARSEAMFTEALGATGIDAVLFLALDPATLEPAGTVASLLDARVTKRLVGFGELLRALALPELGAAALHCHALAGTAGRQALFAMPAAPTLLRLALERLLAPELSHLVGQLRRSPARESDAAARRRPHGHP